MATLGGKGQADQEERTFGAVLFLARSEASTEPFPVEGVLAV